MGRTRRRGDSRWSGRWSGRLRKTEINDENETEWCQRSNLHELSFKRRGENAKCHAWRQKPDRPLNSFKIQSSAKYTIY